MSSIDVLIVGAGPVGLTLATELAIQNVSFRIVDKQPVPSDKSRAIAVHSRTLEVLDRYGHIDELLASSQKVAGNVMYINRKRFDGFNVFGKPLPHTDSRFPGVHAISQVYTEAFLESRLAEHKVAVERPVTVKSIVQEDADVATAVLVNADGAQETVRAKYVVGCDGAHSVVRHAMDVEFQGDAYAQEFILADTMTDWAGNDGRAHLVLGNGLLMVLPLGPDRARVVLSRPTTLSSQADPDLDIFQTALETRLPPEEKPRLHDPFWLTRFHLHHRCATKYRDGRLFVAGDAAHIHSPMGGQGMNTGIQDSVNLGWKLARVLAGDKPDAFLDTYHDERWPVGQHLLNQTDQLFTFLTSNTPVFNYVRDFLLPHALPSMAGSSEMPVRMIKYFSGLGVKYRRSPIVHTETGFEGPVRGGFRAPDGRVQTADGKDLWLQSLLRGPGYHMLLFSAVADDSEIEGPKEKLLLAAHKEERTCPTQVHVITTKDSQNPEAVVDVDGELHRLYGFETKPGFVYVRPDGYIENIGYLG